MTDKVGNSFFSVMLKFISHLSCQQKLIADMGTTCPRVVNRWLSTNKVANWFKTNGIDLLRYIESANPVSAPAASIMVGLSCCDAGRVLQATRQ